MHIRQLTVDDAEASLRASRDAFGNPLPDVTAFNRAPGMRRWGIFDGQTLVAKAVDREYTSMIGGRPIATAGIAGVVVVPECRGAGLARQVMSHALRQARERGAVISTLFRTAPALYRWLGYEQVAELCTARLPTAALRGLSRVGTVRRATVGDAPAIRAVYDRVAAEGSCLLTRTGPSFTATDTELVNSYDGITLAVDPDGAITGYASWNRGTGWGSQGVLAVDDLQATDADALQSLLAVIGSFDAVTPTVTFRTSGTDPLHWLIPGAGWAIDDVKQYLLRIVDLAGAVTQRGWPADVRGSIEFSVDDPVCAWNSGHHRLVIDSGNAWLEAGSGAGASITPRGLAVALAGGVTTAVMRRAGLMTGGSSEDDRLLTAAIAGPRPAILDFF